MKCGEYPAISFASRPSSLVPGQEEELVDQLVEEPLPLVASLSRNAGHTLHDVPIQDESRRFSSDLALNRVSAVMAEVEFAPTSFSTTSVLKRSRMNKQKAQVRP